MKTVPLVLIALLLAACASMPRKSPPPLVQLLLDADPAELLFAEQADAASDAMSLQWRLEVDGVPVSEADLTLERVAAGADPGLGLPPARKSRGWTVWRLAPEGREALAGLQGAIKNRSDGPVSFNFHWSGTPELQVSERDVVYLTHALRRDAGSDWFTIWDNMAVHVDTSE